jgi:hypothetical protein
MSDQARQQQALSLDASRALGDYGAKQYEMERGLTSDLSKYGQDQRAMEQARLDTAYKDFLEQRDWQRDMLNWFNQQVRGGNISSSTMRSDPGANPFAQMAGAGLSAAALYNMSK